MKCHTTPAPIELLEFENQAYQYSSRELHFADLRLEYSALPKEIKIYHRNLNTLWKVRSRATFLNVGFSNVYRYFN